MLELRVPSLAFDKEAYRRRFAIEADAPRQINTPCRVYVDDNEYPSVVYCELDEKLPALVEACKSMKYGVTHRTQGLRTRSKTFGYMPAAAVYQQDACRVVHMAHEYPQQHAVLCSSAKLLSALYKKHNPKVFMEHLEKTKIVVDNYKLSNTPFTSGIVNKDTQIAYHYDTGNFKDVWSNMFTFKEHVIGGNLTCPQLGLTFMLRDHSVLMFDGQNVLHGVTPFVKTRISGYRYTIVYYSLQKMWKCLPPAEEIARADKKQRELTMLRVEPVEGEAGQLRALPFKQSTVAIGKHMANKNQRQRKPAASALDDAV